MRYAIYNHQNKAKPYIDALNQKHERVEFGDHEQPPVDFVFTDTDIYGRAWHLEQFKRNGARWFFIYPHSGRPNLANDIEPVWKNTTAHFVASQGHKNIMKSYGYPRAIFDVGWGLCPIQEFEPRERPESVLFAPIHPRCADVDKNANRRAFERLHTLSERGDIDLTVRYVKDLNKSGLPYVDGVEYVKGNAEPGWKQIDEADVVVAHQTFLYLAVARGVPAVGLGTDIPPHLIPGKRIHYAENWEKYKNDLVFPLDIENDDPMNILEDAVGGNKEVQDWKERMIGEPFDTERLHYFLDTYLEY